MTLYKTVTTPLLHCHDPVQDSQDCLITQSRPRDRISHDHDPVQDSHDPVQDSHDPLQDSHDPVFISQLWGTNLLVNFSYNIRYSPSYPNLDFNFSPIENHSQNWKGGTI